MNERLGLRERKKDATRIRLTKTALDMFEERGFDAVSVAEIAEAAEVSKKTVFNYFEVKEDLILGAGKHHIGETARVIHDRPIGQTPHGAIREHWLKSLEERQPMTGLSDHPFVLRIIRLTQSTPALIGRRMHYDCLSRDLLAKELVAESSSELSSRLIAAQIFVVQQELSGHNFRRIAAGVTADELYPEAVGAAEHAFRFLENGFGELLPRKA
ncbi:MAG: TetR/AcrR family transcriptional regulator [Stackebrandtia sp.]